MAGVGIPNRVARLATVVGFALSIIVALAQQPGTAQAQTPTTAANVDVVPNRYIVVLKNTFTESAEQFAAAVNQRPGAEVDLTYTAAFNGFAGEFTTAAITSLITDPAVADVFVDGMVHAQGQVLEPNINRVDADLSWSKSGNGSGTVDVDVAVIDSGVGPNNDLNVVGGYNCMGDGYMRDYYGHGTHVAGIIAAKDNGSGVVGMAPGARIWQVRSLDRYGGGTWSQIICGMDWVTAHADVIEVANMSLGAGMAESGTGCNSSPAHLAICAMTNAGVTVMAAACNAGTDARTCTPGKYPEVISVSAFAEFDGKPGGKGGCRTTPDGFYGCDDQRASFSNYGPTVDIAAPGVGVRSTLFDNKYGYWSGTSMATPHVTGAAALLVAKYGRLAPAEVRSRLLLSAAKGPVPGDFDAYPEPILNVASLGVGSMTRFSSLHNGDRITIVASELLPATRAIFTLDGNYLGGATVGTDGKATRNLTIADLPYGKHEFRITNNNKTVTDAFLIRPSIALSPPSGIVGGNVAISLRGYTPNSSTLISLDTGSGVRSLVRVNTDALGVAFVTVPIPSTSGGARRLTATDSAGVTTSVRLTIVPTLSVQSPVAAGEWAAVSLRGFASGETVDLRWGSATGTILRSKTVTGNGSGDLSVRIPANSTAGSHSLWAIGSSGNRVRVTVVTTLSQSTVPTATANSTASATGTVASSPTISIATETILSTATSEPTATATPAPSTETATAIPTETSVPTETATAVPTETATAPPADTMTATPIT